MQFRLKYEDKKNTKMKVQVKPIEELNHPDGRFDGSDSVTRARGYGMEWAFSKMDRMCTVLDHSGTFALCEVYKSPVCVHREL